MRQRTTTASAPLRTSRDVQWHHYELPTADTSHGQCRTQRHVLETERREGDDAARDRANHVVVVEAKLDALRGGTAGLSQLAGHALQRSVRLAVPMLWLHLQVAEQ
jgi:hypothetical protein